MNKAADCEIEQYFKHVVLKYNCGDIRLLLKQKLEACGPLLTCTMNGIDLLGGMIHGFDRKNIRARSVAFMRSHLAIPGDLADLLYRLVRCGITHEGVAKSRILFFVRYDDARPADFFFTEGNLAVLDVTELARRYLDAVKSISLNIRHHVHFVPSQNDKDADAISTLAYGSTATFDDLRNSLPDGYLIHTGSGGPSLMDWISAQPELMTMFLSPTSEGE